MSSTKNTPGQVLSIHSLEPDPNRDKSMAIFKSDDLEIIRLPLLANKKIPVHSAPAHLTIHCLKGHIMFSANETPQEMKAGDLICLTPDQKHSLEGIEDSELLLSIFKK